MPTREDLETFVDAIAPVLWDGSVKGWMRASVLKDDPPGDAKHSRKKKTDDADDGDSGD